MDTGFDVNSMEDPEMYICADDFECNSPLPVHDVHWWGSYWAGQDPQPIDGFVIRFFDDAGGLPGPKVYEQYITGPSNETFYGFSPYDNTNVYQYDCVLPEPFDQVPGRIYWLSVSVDQGWDDTPYWGWHTSAADFLSDAMQAEQPEPWAWNPIIDEDFAFELTVVPEPSTVVSLVLAAAIGGLMLLRRRKR